MSTQTDFYSVDETPTEGDPTNEEMMTPEELLLERLHLGIHTALPLWHPQHIGAERRKHEVEELLKDAAEFIKQAIADRNRMQDTDEEWADPFADMASE